MEYRVFKAKTVSEAVTEALIELEITSDMIEYEVIEEGSTGLLGLFSKDAVIRARRKESAPKEEDLFDIKVEIRAGSLMDQEKSKAEKKTDKAANVARKNTEKVETKKESKQTGTTISKETETDKSVKQALKAGKKAPASTSVSSEKVGAAPAAKTPNKGIDITEARNTEPKPDNKIAKAPAVVKDVDEEVLRRVLNEIFEKLDIKADISIKVNKEERTVEITVDGDNTGDLIGKRGQTLDAIQYILSIIVNKEQESYFRVKLDTNNYRERRQKTLENLAKNMAAKVKKTRKKVTLEPMNPYERRVIHSYLQSDKMVTTKSEGEEPNRRVVIYYKKS